MEHRAKVNPETRVEPKAEIDPNVEVELTAELEPKVEVEATAKEIIENEEQADEEKANELTYTPAVVLQQRDDDPENPDDVYYRERLLWVSIAQTDEQLQSSVLAELATLISELEVQSKVATESHFAQIALFDHFFDEEPLSPPVATLSWQSWLPDPPEIWVRGRCVSGSEALEPEQRPPDSPVPSGTQLVGGGERRENHDSEPMPLTRRKTAELQELEAANNDQLGRLFERMHELLYCDSLGDGAQYILSSLTRSVPASGILIHIFDAEKRQFVLVRARGPKSQALLLARTSPLGTHLEEALRRQETLKLTNDPQASTHGLWVRLGLHLHHGLCCPVQESRRYLGAIELGRESSEPPFTATDVHALEYVSQQFSDFLAERSLQLDDASLLPRG